MKRFFLSTLSVFASLAALTGCSSLNSDGYVRNSGVVFGTSFNMIYRSDVNLLSDVEQRLAVYDASLSVFNDSSLLSQFNRSLSVDADSDLLFVVKQALRFHRLSHGAFDCSVEPLSRLWHFSADADLLDTLPQSVYDSIVSLVPLTLQSVGMDKVSVVGSRIIKSHPGLKLNANALAEGFGIDCAARVLEEHGVSDYLVEIGGEIHCKGLSPRGSKWRIGVDKPSSSAGVSGSQRIIEVSNCAVSTSGNYRQCHYAPDGSLLQHTIDPRTGRPVSHGMKSVTVVGPNTMTTDALCTCLMVLGPDSVASFVNRIRSEEHIDVEAYVIYDNADGVELELETDGWKNL